MMNPYFRLALTTTIRHHHHHPSRTQLLQARRQYGSGDGILLIMPSRRSLRAMMIPANFIQQASCGGPDEVSSSSLQQFRNYSSSTTYKNASSSSSSSCSKKKKVAIVGSGPSGCYTAKYLKSTWEKQQQQQQQAPTPTDQSDENTTTHMRLQIDVMERLPTPYGLVRFGVAPDHPEVKNVQNDFDTLFQNNDKTSSSSSSSSDSSTTTTTAINFYGNVQVGRDISLQELRQRYHAVVLATGCESDRPLGIPGEGELEGILPAREFVAWYNGHPDFDHVGPIVEKALASGFSNDTDDNEICQVPVVVIGQGNVALDCARILAKGRPGLMDTDICSRALPILRGGVSHVVIVGRRGHVQGAFTIKELRELVELQADGHDTAFCVRPDELDMGRTEASLQELASKPGGRPKKRIDKLLSKAAAEASSDTDEPASAKKRVDLRFLLSPCRFESLKRDDDDNADSSSSSASLGAVVCERTRLEGDAGAQKAVGTGEFETIPARLALVSIGYKGVALPGMVNDNNDNNDLFDAARGVARNVHGRIQSPVINSSEESSSSTSSLSLGGLYASGWIKRGPSGIIGTNIPDAKDTVATVMEDLTTCPPVECDKQDEDDDLESLLGQRNVAVVTWEGYQRIVERENTNKRTEAQPREKITNLQEQIETALGRGR